jgi:hypothetical protein
MDSFLAPVVSEAEGRELATSFKMPYCETSAKSGLLVNETFTQLAETVADRCVRARERRGRRRRRRKTYCSSIRKRGRIQVLGHTLILIASIPITIIESWPPPFFSRRANFNLPNPHPHGLHLPG